MEPVEYTNIYMNIVFVCFLFHLLSLYHAIDCEPFRSNELTHLLCSGKEGANKKRERDIESRLKFYW